MDPQLEPLELIGIPASPGFAIGPAYVLAREELPIRDRFVPAGGSEVEVRRFEEATAKAQEEIKGLQDRLTNEVGEGSAAIFGAHLWILSDRGLKRNVVARITDNHFTAEYALDRTIQKYVKRLRALGDVYLAQRVQDIEDVERRVLAILGGERGEALDSVDEPVVVVAHSLSPSQTASFDREKVVGIATDVGGRTSHAAILARDMGIPAIVGLETASADIGFGDLVILDGNKGELLVSPDEETVERYRGFLEEYAGFERRLAEESHLPAETLDGIAIEVFGNIEFPEEIPSVVDHGAEGIGLYRTEFLFLTSGKMPTEQDHIEAYRAALSFLGGRPILIRTLDIGADKVVSGPGAREPERNPFLGCRSIRLCKVFPDIFKTQMRAILRVSTEGNVKCMLPMISTLEELRWAKGLIEEVKDDLRKEGQPFNPDLETGIMMEVPAAVVMADRLAEEADFFSIGTNDLIQYVMAIDRTNEHVAWLYSPAEPAVLRLISMVMETGGRRGIPISMCGEMAGDPLFVVLLLGMGLRRFSVAPVLAPEVKKLIRSVSIEDAEKVAERVLPLGDPQEILSVLEQETRKVLPDVFVQRPDRAGKFA